MKQIMLALALAMPVLPAAAIAQEGPGYGPPPEVRAQMMKARDDARGAAMNGLSADHRAKVQAIITQVQNGTLSREDAQTQIDAILSPQESQTVLAQGQKLRDAMRAAMAARNEQRPNGQQDPNGMQRRGPDAGRMLLMLNMRPPDRPPEPQQTQQP